MLREGTRVAGVSAFSAFHLKTLSLDCFAGFNPLCHCAIMEIVAGSPIEVGKEGYRLAVEG